MAANRVVTVRCRFSRPPDEVWKAWTVPALMRQWFGSDPNGIVSSAQADVRVDGRFEVSFSNANGDGYTCFGTYLDVEPGKRLAFTWSWTSRPAWAERITVSFEPENGGTSMSFEHADIDPQTTHDYAAGWRRTFDKLENVLQGHGRSET